MAAEAPPPYDVVGLDELDAIRVGEHGLRWRPVRRRLAIEAFGVNAYTAERAGEEVVEHHDETGYGAGKHEELYVVIRGRARFTLDDQVFDAPTGTFVFVREAAVKRGAHAEEDGTTVLALGGKPGEPFQVSPWEYYFAGFPAYEAKDYETALQITCEGLERYPDNPSILFSVACIESLSGDRESALEHLRRAIAANPKLAAAAREDSDFGPLRDDPRFLELVEPQS